MIRSLTCLAAAFLSLAGCASAPAPVQRMADAEAATRAAQEVGPSSDPRAQLHLLLAQDEVSRAKGLVSDGDNDRASYVLLRAKADADLSLALTRAARAEAEAAHASATAAAAGPGAVGTTTTTGAVIPH